MAPIYGAKNILGKKFSLLYNFMLEIFFGSWKILSIKNLRFKKFGVKEIFWDQKIFGIFFLKISRPKKILGKKIFVRKIFLVKKNVGPKNL